MIFSFNETPASRQSTYSPPSLTLIYKAVGEVDDGQVGSYAIAATPSVVYTAAGTLYRQNIQLDPEGYAQYLVTIPYGPKQKANGSYSFTFDTTGATVTVKAAKEHIASYPAGDPADPHKGAIGVTANGDVEGTEIVIPALKFTVNFRHPQGVITLAQARHLARQTGKTNTDEFLGFAAGELLFLGASGGDGTETEAEVAYQFAASENVSDLSFGEISGVTKKGHHYAWIEFKDAASDGQASTQPRRVHVERVYGEVAFATALGWS